MALHNQLAIILITSGLILIFLSTRSRRRGAYRNRSVLGKPSDRCKRNGPEALP